MEVTDRGAAQRKKKEKKAKSSPNRVVQFITVHHATVNEFHMVIDVTRSEHSHTRPTNMRIALRAIHVVAASVLLDQDIALRALLDVLVTLSPTFQQPMHLPFLTTEPVVLLPTRNADRHEARSAPEGSTSGVGFEGVEFGTIRSGAILELLGVAAEVVEE